MGKGIIHPEVDNFNDMGRMKNTPSMSRVTAFEFVVFISYKFVYFSAIHYL
jgi:hypothetical protein